MKKANSILWGIVLVAAGLLLGLNSLDIISFNIFFDGWWTLFIIIPSFIGLITDREKAGSIIGLCIGVFLLLCCQDVLSFDLLFKLLFPFIIVVIGAKMIFGTIKSKKTEQIMDNVVMSGKNVQNVCATFSGQDVYYAGQEFSGAELTAVFGGIKCDLRGAIIANDCAIKVSSIFGGIDIFVPENVNVKVNSTSLFGGISDKKHTNSKSNEITIYVEGTALFGGVDIK